MANWNLGGLNWSDDPINIGGNTGESDNMSYSIPGADLGQVAWNQLGYNGEFSPYNETENSGAFNGIDPHVADWMQKNGTRVGVAWDPSGTTRYTGIFSGNNKLQSNPLISDMDDSDFGIAMQLAAGMMGNVGLEFAGWGSGFGGGAVGHAVKGATLGSIGSGLAGGNPFTGAVTGALSGGAVGAINPAGQIGITNPAISNVVNNSVGSGLRSLVGGGSLADAGKAALTSGITSTIGEGGKYLANNIGDNMSLYDLPGSGATVNGDFQTAANASPDQYSNEARFDTPGLYRDSPPMASMFQQPQQPNERAASGFNLPEFNFNLPNMGQVGSWALNNAGDLASMLYGMYNNNKARRQLGGMIGGLQGLYSQNSPYAQNLRASLAAKDAAAGRRSQYGAREVQLQSNLAHMASQQAPALFQMQMGRNQLQNQNMMGILNTLQKTGAFKGLQGLFGQQPQAPQLQAPAFGSNLNGLPNMFNPQSNYMYNPIAPVQSGVSYNGITDDYGMPLGD